MAGVISLSPMAGLATYPMYKCHAFSVSKVVMKLVTFLLEKLTIIALVGEASAVAFEILLGNQRSNIVWESPMGLPSPVVGTDVTTRAFSTASGLQAAHGAHASCPSNIELFGIILHPIDDGHGEASRHVSASLA